MAIKRAVGYCQNGDCENYINGVFLLNHSDMFFCPRCRQLGSLEAERGTYVGEAEIFREVRVEYDFDPTSNSYRSTAIVRDENTLGPANVYTLNSPLVKTQQRALKIAEQILSNLNRYRGLCNGELNTAIEREHLLRLDSPYEEFCRTLQEISKGWEMKKEVA